MVIQAWPIEDFVTSNKSIYLLNLLLPWPKKSPNRLVKSI